VGCISYAVENSVCIRWRIEADVGVYGSRLHRAVVLAVVFVRFHRVDLDLHLLGQLAMAVSSPVCHVVSARQLQDCQLS
jgi:hypothetical protein